RAPRTIRRPAPPASGAPSCRTGIDTPGRCQTGPQRTPYMPLPREAYARVVTYPAEQSLTICPGAGIRDGEHRFAGNHQGCAPRDPVLDLRIDREPGHVAVEGDLPQVVRQRHLPLDHVIQLHDRELALVGRPDTGQLDLAGLFQPL